jgi:hypothetical protein
MPRCKFNYVGSKMHKSENRKPFRTVDLSTFSSNRSPNLVLKPLKKCSNRRPKCFSVFENLRLGSINLVAFRHYLHLLPGDLIFTGTCHARGAILKSTRWRGHARRTDARRRRVLGERKPMLRGDDHGGGREAVSHLGTCYRHRFGDGTRP